MSSSPRLRKALGQHHLRQGERCRPAVEFLRPEGSTVVEVGPGGGVLTRELLAAGARVVGWELDLAWAAELRRRLAGAGLPPGRRRRARAAVGAMAAGNSRCRQSAVRGRDPDPGALSPPRALAAARRLPGPGRGGAAVGRATGDQGLRFSHGDDGSARRRSRCSRGYRPAASVRRPRCTARSSASNAGRRRSRSSTWRRFARRCRSRSRIVARRSRTRSRRPVVGPRPPPLSRPPESTPAAAPRRFRSPNSSRSSTPSSRWRARQSRERRRKNPLEC